MLRLAAKKEQFETALFIYGSVKHSWHGLYLVYDAIKLGNGGKEDDLKAKNFAPSSSIKDFTATANSYAAVGLDARHGPQSAQVQVPKMTLEEARTLIRTLLNAWARELRQGEAS